MRIIEPSVTLLAPPSNALDALRHVERCGRVCYKSEGKITPYSYAPFIERLMARGHEAVLEHGNLIVGLDSEQADDIWMRLMQSGFRSYLRYTSGKSGAVVSGNFRAWRDTLRQLNDLHVSISYDLVDILNAYHPIFDNVMGQLHLTNYRVSELGETELEDEIEKRVHMCRTLRFICDRGVSHEIVRHRPASFCQESTRYCNYAKDDFNGEITVIKPCFFDAHSAQYGAWETLCRQAEAAYFDLMTRGDCTPQQARTVLPNSLKTEVVMTANLEEWLHFLRLRCSEAAHPQMREVATLAKGLLLHSVPAMEGWLR